jgi:RimJ/RimL family protein N-acetyltransferase
LIGLLTLITNIIIYRGQGYATEAAKALINDSFNVLKLHRIQAIASSGNPKSIQVIEWLGMQPEGRLRDANFKDGE